MPGQLSLETSDAAKAHAGLPNDKARNLAEQPFVLLLSGVNLDAETKAYRTRSAHHPPEDVPESPSSSDWIQVSLGIDEIDSSCIDHLLFPTPRLQ